jgi:hypothetical protein
MFRVHRSRALTVGTGIALILSSLGGALLVGAFGGSAASAQGTGPEAHQHYLCYTATAKEFKAPAPVTLFNMFSPNGFVPKIGNANIHCNPAEKVVQAPPGPVTYPILDPTLHRLCLSITAPKQTSTAVPITNQFGKAQLLLGQPNELCLPSWKSLTGPPNMTPNAPVANHYVCYPAKYVPGTPPFQPPGPVSVSDEFSPALVPVRVGPPLSLCVPTRKMVGSVTYPIVDSTLFNVCFTVTKTPIIPKVFDQNQFGQGKVKIKATKSLCLPSSLG